MTANTIPKITDPLGRHWRQPSEQNITVDDTHALMSAHNFEALYEYSTTRPTGVYPGKMWRAQVNGVWWLRWFGVVEGRPDLCSNNQRRILVA